MVRKGNLAVFERYFISETGEATPTKTGVHACDINPYLHKFFEPILFDSFFTPMDYTMVSKANLSNSDFLLLFL